MQLNFLPLKTLEIDRAVDAVIKLIEDSGINYEVNDFSTILRGESGAMLELLGKINEHCENEGIHYSMNITMSNYCACEMK